MKKCANILINEDKFNRDLHVKSDTLAFLKKVVDNEFLHKVGIQSIIYRFCSAKLERSKEKKKLQAHHDIIET